MLLLKSCFVCAGNLNRYPLCLVLQDARKACSDSSLSQVSMLKAFPHESVRLDISRSNRTDQKTIPGCATKGKESTTVWYGATQCGAEFHFRTEETISNPGYDVPPRRCFATGFTVSQLEHISRRVYFPFILSLHFVGRSQLDWIRWGGSRCARDEPCGAI